MSKRNEFLDIMKIICCILVICIHTKPLINISYTMDFILRQVIARIAVPYFFLISGYFLGKKIYINNIDGIKKYLKKISFIFLFWTVIYFICYSSIVFDNNWVSIAKFIRDYLIVGYHHLWYLKATIVSIFLILLIYENGYEKQCFFIAFCIYLIGVLGNSYSFIFSNKFHNLFDIYYDIFCTTRNGLFFAFPFMSIGVICSSIKFKHNVKRNLLLFLASSFCFTIEVFLLNSFGNNKYYDMYIFLLPTITYLFLLLMSLKELISLREEWKIRIYSIADLTLIVYCVHILVISFLGKIFYTSVGGKIFLVTTTVSFIFSWFYKSILLRKKSGKLILQYYFKK